ncbi:hypothetical protein AFCDBAGC_1229 [Methylobacterium cerastii]|uniref:Uncharacterized protein n=1 Tax=Methylobacterium cerastii TaxID=932741 RepID=A0ABQ4QDU2_9HYPH|nr:MULTISPECIES: hypothetical protein [Methylobacterium]TXN84169.1 hypothetical protein FV234_04215 [Methylobacterium sp. WL8]GJD43377.1 hypothetical protein AFCDBAGC_1229 [Methylobacterium cerastii]
MAGVATEKATVPGLATRMAAFRSLGGNCEFGFVQRYCGAEPSGLLRFSYTPLDDLIDALETRFERYGAPSDLVLAPTETGVYYCRSRTYNIWSNTQRTVAGTDHDALLEREYGRVAHLKARMLADLATGEKILVRKADAGQTDADFQRLAEAVWRHGPSTLLRVREAAPGSATEPLRRTGDLVLEGSVRRFAPGEQAWDVELESWVALCDAAYAARAGVAPAALAAAPSADAMRLPRRTTLHAAHNQRPGFSAYTKLLDTTRFDPATPYVFSAWIRIPADASPERIFAALGRERLGWCDADLGIRDRWQRIWAAGRVGDGTDRPCVGLGLIGDAGDRFESRDWHLREGAVPDWSAPPPPEAMGFFARLRDRLGG